MVKYLFSATKEQAYVYAISSASLTFTLARACSSGSLQHCTCASKPEAPSNGQFQWGGCGDNVNWGAQFAKRFLDNVEKHDANEIIGKGKEDVNGFASNKIALANLHNNRLGRKVGLNEYKNQIITKRKKLPAFDQFYFNSLSFCCRFHS